MRLDADELWLSPTDLGTHLECHHATRSPSRRRGGPGRGRRAGRVRRAAVRGRAASTSGSTSSPRRRGPEVEAIDVDGAGFEAAATLTDARDARGRRRHLPGGLRGGRLAGPADFLERCRRRPTWAPGATRPSTPSSPAGGAAAPRAPARRLQPGDRADPGLPTPSAMHLELGRAPPTSIRSATWPPTSAARSGPCGTRWTGGPPTEPFPCAHCDVCGFRRHAMTGGRPRTHLSRVAGIRAATSSAARPASPTLGALGAPGGRPSRPGIRPETLEALRDQARLQVKRRDPARSHGSAADRARPRLRGLPPRATGDSFLDLEGDPFWEPERELTFLFGIVARDGGSGATGPSGATTRRRSAGLASAHRHAHAGLAADPGMHVYHYSPAEPSALSAMGAHASARTRSTTCCGRGLRGPLHRGPAGLRGRRRSYGLKTTERLAGFTRSAARGRAPRRCWPMRLAASDDRRELDAIAAYNEEDCGPRSRCATGWWTAGPRAEWCGARRRTPAEAGPDGARRARGAARPWSTGEAADQPRWLAGELLEYHRREARPAVVAVFARLGWTRGELIADGEAIGGLERTGPPPTARAREPALRRSLPRRRSTSSTPGRASSIPATRQGARRSAHRRARRGRSRSAGRDAADEPLPRALIPGEPIARGTSEDALARLGRAFATAPDATRAPRRSLGRARRPASAASRRARRSRRRRSRSSGASRAASTTATCWSRVRPAPARRGRGAR